MLLLTSRRGDRCEVAEKTIDLKVFFRWQLPGVEKMNPAEPAEPSGKRRRENSRSGESLQKLLVTASDEDPLCCCEYINDKGERSHVLGFCCDCETLDDSFERLMQGQPQPKGRGKEICSVFLDRCRFPWVNGARKVHPDILLPPVILSAAMWLATCGPWFTVLSFPFILMAIHVVRKCLLKRRGTKFYGAFTLTSFLLSYLIFEFKVNYFEGISQWNYWMYVVLLSMTIFLMYQTRRRGREDKNLPLVGNKLPSYYYCRTCQFYVDGRDHHCVWLDCCVGRENKPWFLVAIFLGCCWIMYTISLTLRVVCDPVEFFGTFTVPLNCSAAYENYDTALSFVSVVYGMILLVLLSMILTHQLRLVWRGVSYLDWKYGKLSAIAAENKLKTEVAVVT